MQRVKPKATVISSPAKRSTVTGGGGSEAAAAAGGWEIRPGGMLVQQRNSDSNQISIQIPIIKLRVKYGSSYHEINISSQASFGELKKILEGTTGLNHQDQKLIYKEKERDSKVFLDVAGVKNGSKMVLVEDTMRRERRFLDMRKTAKMDKASKEIADIAIEVDKLAKQVANLELEIFGGKKVAETGVLNLIELLMTQLIKLDGIIGDGDVKLQRRLQVNRVQKYIETLDMLKIRNSMLESHGVAKAPLEQRQKHSNGQMPIPKNNNKNEQRTQRAVSVTTKWETFDSSLATKFPFTSTSSTTTSQTSKLNWEVFE